ncbi:MAG: hypothetical protein KKB50_04625 [Planctomycetes bacterium]|nr:hypothetical protein [Planctomycetota bacterium]
MVTSRLVRIPTLLAFLFCLWWAADLPAQTIPGEKLDPATYGPSYVESMQAAIERDRLAPAPVENKERGQRQGIWAVPSRRATSFRHSGEHYATNKWGDTRLGIGFPQLVDVQGAYFAGQADEAVWTTGVRVVAYRNGEVAQETGWFTEIGAEPRWFAMDLQRVDRIEIIAIPTLNGGGWYGMDDLTYTLVAAEDAAPTKIVVDFDDLPYNHKLTETDYAGLTWETGSGDFSGGEAVHGPLAPPGVQVDDGGAGGIATISRDSGTPPSLSVTYQGVIRGDAGSMSYPPDTDGAIGPNHYVETVNRNFAIYDKASGAELTNILLGSFLPGSNGDPRVLFDHHSGRWIVHVTDFSATATVFLAVSLTDDPTGDWFKTSFLTAQGSDAGRWPDYPTLGVDQYGIYIAAYMVGGSGMTIFALDKAPLVDPSPSLGTITAWRNLPWEGAIQPAHAYGSPEGEYLVSLYGSSALRVRRVNPPLTSPTLTEMGNVGVPSFGDPPNAPALGSSVPLNTVDDRLMMSVYRDGSLWTAHTISANGRAGCRWYEVDVDSMSLIQSGTVADGALYYFFPSIMVNQDGDVAMGFTGSKSDQYAACYFTGRRATDPLGEMAPPEMYKEGTGPQNNVDGYGRNRWGDYSYTTLDPVDQRTFWSIQEYGHSDDIWGTYIAVLTTGATPPHASDVEVATDVGTPVTVELVANDDGLPDPPGQLSYIIVSLPAHGTLSDPGAGPIGSVPYTLVTYGNEVVYTPTGTYQGLDEFTFQADDSGDPPDGGLSNSATVSITVGGPQLIHDFPLDTNPGWTTESQWAFGQPTGGGGEYGGPDPTSGYTGNNVYGYNLNGDYANNIPEYDLTTPAIDCTGVSATTLKFQRWLGVEQPSYDHAYVRVSNNGSNWTTVWQNNAEVADYAWVEMDLDISAVADDQPTVYVRWTMGTTDGGWHYCGWNIDDVQIWGIGPAPYAPGDLNCDGSIDGFDIDPFVLVLGDSEPYDNYYAQYPNCDHMLGDINEDGLINGFDIDAFVILLGG